MGLLGRLWRFLMGNDTILMALITGITVAIANTLKSNLQMGWQWVLGKILFIVTITNNSDLYDAFDEWYFQNYPANFRNNMGKFDTDYEGGIAAFKLRLTPIASLSIISYNGRSMLLKKKTEEFYEEGTIEYEHTYALIGHKAKDVRDFLDYLEEYWNVKQGKEGLCIIMKDNYGGSNHIYRKLVKSFDDLFFPGKDELITHIDTFVSSKHIFEQRRIKYKTGILLSGVVGGGKTDTCLAIAHYLKRNVYYVAPNLFSQDVEFQQYMLNVKPGSIIIMEDVDDYFGNRENGTESKTALSFSSVLNTLDGIFSPSDIILLMTTNYPEKLDTAILRKGRLDYHLEISNPTGKYIDQYVQHYYGKDVPRFLNDKFYPGVPMVDIEHICRSTETFEEAKIAVKNLIK